MAWLHRRTSRSNHPVLVAAVSPFIVYALPRSRTKWLARFLAYGDYDCAHDQIRYVRGLADVRAWLAQDFTGAVETGAARWWRLIQNLRPDLRTVVVRRPVAEVVESLLRLDLSGICTFDRAALLQVLRRMDRALDRIAAQPGVLSVRFADLDREDACAAVFQHCLPYPHDHGWWDSWRNLNIQADMRAMMRYFVTHQALMTKAGVSCRKQLRAVLEASTVRDEIEFAADGISIAEENFATFWRDGQALFRDHAAEVGPRDEVTLDINVPLIEALEHAGASQIMVARCNGRMFGYLATVIAPSLEDRNLVTAVQNVFYVAKDFRGLGMRLQRASLDRLAARGVGEIVMRAGVRGSGPDLGALYRRLGAQDYGRLFNLMVA